MTPFLLFFIIATIICLGFAGSWMFRLTRIPDALLLIAAGLGLRTLLKVDVSLVQGVAPYFGAFALLVILFEGGLHLDFELMLKSWRQAIKLLSLSFLFSFGLIFLISDLAFGRPPLHAALLASAVACTSAAIVIPLIREVKTDPGVKTVLELESSLSDAIAVLFTVTVLNLVRGEGEMADQIGPVIFSSLTGALVVGIGAGLAWMWVLKKLSGQPLLYLMTFAGMLMVYAVSEALHSSGVFGVFVFALTFSNGPKVLAKLFPNFRGKEIIEQLSGSDIGRFHAELTFLVRTFFFVFLGMLFDFSHLTWKLLAEGVAIFVMVLLARLIAVRFSFLRGQDPASWHGARVLFLFMPRGLATAVLATLPAAYGLHGTQDFVTVTVLVILFTNLAITIGVRWVERTAEDGVETK
ncbi:MAG: cation:proton antiporter [Calditrichota bacterium]